MKFNENRSKGSGDMERTRKCYGRTDEGHSYNPHPLHGRQLTKQEYLGSVEYFHLISYKSYNKLANFHTDFIYIKV